MFILIQKDKINYSTITDTVKSVVYQMIWFLTLATFTMTRQTVFHRPACRTNMSHDAWRIILGVFWPNQVRQRPYDPKVSCKG